MRNRRHYFVVTGLVLVAAVLVYFLLDRIYQLPTAASDEADTIDNMFDVYFGLIAFMFSLIMVFMIYAAFAFRRKPDDTTDAAHIRGNMRLEVVWTIIPTIIVLALGGWGATTLSALTKAKTNEVEIAVTGQQWLWSFEYPEHDSITSGELVLLVDQPVLLKMTSTDVIHSFWVPEFRVKQDLVPGMETLLRITPTDAGEYTLACAEICGLSHTDMVADVRVLNQNAYNAWVDENLQAPVFADLSAEERGEIWYGTQPGFGCVACHSVDGSAGVGPTWLGLFGRQENLDDGTTILVDDAYLRESILYPNAQIVEGYLANIMSNQDYETLFSEAQADILANEGVEIDIVDDLIAYIKTLEE
jgi:cytochrome c oxidase subunit 2